jgi:predicted transcriptional regulator
MKPINNLLLRLQFENRILRKNGTEFQSFFEEIMTMAYPDFQKIRPYGLEGDAGNDGYIPSKGAYYQVYAPHNPEEKDAAAAIKLKTDFEKLKTNWNEISKIKIYNFVFNDKGRGSTKIIEKTLSELKKAYHGITFNLFSPKNLEDVFSRLKEEDILYLGFEMDEVNSVKIARGFLEWLEVYLDRENPNYAFRAIDNIEDTLKELKNEELDFNFQILRARAFYKLERVSKAKDIYENLCLRYPKEPRPYLYLAEYYLVIENYYKNEELLKKASEIDEDYWLLKLEKLARELHLNNQIDIKDIDENSFPDDNRIKSAFYRIYAIILAKFKEHERAMSFIERAIHYNPDRFHNYDAKLTVLEMKLFDQGNKEEILSNELEYFSNEIEYIEKKVNEWGEITPRTKAVLNLKRADLFFARQNIQEIDKIAEPTFQSLLNCHFDSSIDGLLVAFLTRLKLSQDALDQLSKYLEKAEKPISKDLLKMIAIQYAERGNLTNKGREFFTKVNEKAMVEFINNVKENNFDEAWKFLEPDQNFAVSIAVTLNENPDFRNIIIERLPDNEKVQKEKILFFINYKEDNIDEAFKHVKAFDFSKTSYYECKPILEIAEKKEAWDDVIILAKKLLSLEKDQRIVLQLKLQLFNANNHLNNFSEVIWIGEELLCDDHAIETLDELNKEALLGQTIQARLRRSEYAAAKSLLEQYANLSKTFEFKIAIEAEVFIRNNEGAKALSSVVSAVKALIRPAPEQYGILFATLTEIGNMINMPLISMDVVTGNCYVKFKEHEWWYFVGDGDELDATKISTTDRKYNSL